MVGLANIWMKEYFCCMRTNLFIIVQIGLTLFLINNQIGFIASELQQLSSIEKTDPDTYLYQYSMAAAGLFDLNGDYEKACKMIQSLPGVKGIGEIFENPVIVDGDLEKYMEEGFEITAMDSIATSAVTYHVQEGRWLDEKDMGAQEIHAVLGGSIMNQYSLGDIINIELLTDGQKERYQIKVVGKLAEHCNTLDMHSITPNQDIYAFMQECGNDIYVNHNKIFNDLKKFKFGYSNANCIVKLDKKADKEHLSGYGKLVSFDEMKQQTERSIQTFIKESVEEDILWAVVIIFGIIATTYLIGKNRRYVWGIYLMLGEKPKKLLKIHLISNAINYIIGVIAALVTYKIMYKNEEMSSKTDINQYHIMIDLFFLVIMMAVSLISSLSILKIEPKEILTQTKE